MPAPITATSVASMAAEYHPRPSPATSSASPARVGLDQRPTQGDGPPTGVRPPAYGVGPQNSTTWRSASRASGTGAGGRRAAGRARRRTGQVPAGRLPAVRRARRTPAGAGRGCRSTSTSAAARPGRPGPADPRVGQRHRPRPHPGVDLQVGQREPRSRAGRGGGARAEVVRSTQGASSTIRRGPGSPRSRSACATASASRRPPSHPRAPARPARPPRSRPPGRPGASKESSTVVLRGQGVRREHDVGAQASPSRVANSQPRSAALV